MELTHQESQVIHEAVKTAFNMKKCLKSHKDKDNPESYCNKIEYYIDNQMGWPRLPSTLEKLKKQLKQKGKDLSPLTRKQKK